MSTNDQKDKKKDDQKRVVQLSEVPGTYYTYTIIFIY